MTAAPDGGEPTDPAACPPQAPNPHDLYVFPGQVVVSAEPRHLSTVLGSCVAVCLYDPALRVGGMNHFLLPSPVGGKSWSPRFAGPAVQQLVGQVLGLGADSRRLLAKLFGGTTPADPARNGFHVGWRNVEAARRLLHDEGIPLIAEDVGGPRGRRLVFQTYDGTAWVRHI